MLSRLKHRMEDILGLKGWDEAAKPQSEYDVGLRMRMNVLIEAFHVDGRYEKVSVHNITTNAGLNFLTDRVFNAGSAPSAMSSIHIGTSATAAAATDTTLAADLQGSFGASAGNFTDTGTGICTWDSTFTSNSPSTLGIQESGIFNSSSTMLARVTFAVVNLVSGDAIKVTWTLTFT